MNKELLGDRVEFTYGFSVRIDDEPKGKYPIYGSNGITGFIGSFKVSAPGIIIGRKGTVGAVTFSSENFTPTDTTYYIELKDEERDDLKFWYYYLQLLGLDKLNTHSAVPGLSRDLAYLKNIQVPGKSTQQKIAHILSTLDAKIALNNRISKELEAMAKTIYDYWFVQFEFPNEDGKPHKSSGGRMVWNEDLKREVPEGWECYLLKDYLEFERGIEPGTANYFTTKETDNHIPFYKVGGMDKEISTWILKSMVANKIAIEDDILVSFDGTVGRIAIGLNGAYSTGMRKIYPIKEYFPKAFIYFTFQSQDIQKTIKKNATGSNILHASKAIEYLAIPYKKEIVKLFNEKTEHVFKKLLQLNKENRSLVTIRDFLLPLLMNGQVVVG